MWCTAVNVLLISCEYVVLQLWMCYASGLDVWIVESQLWICFIVLLWMICAPAVDVLHVLQIPALKMMWIRTTETNCSRTFTSEFYLISSEEEVEFTWLRVHRQTAHEQCSNLKKKFTQFN